MIKIGRFRAATVEVWAILVLYSETRRSKVTSLSYFWAFICLDWKPAGCSVAFCAQASLVAHFLSPTAHMIPIGTRRQVVVNMYDVCIPGEERTLTFYSVLANYFNSYHLSRYSTGLPYMCTHISQQRLENRQHMENWQHIYEFTNTHNLFLSLIFCNDSSG